MGPSVLLHAAVSGPGQSGKHHHISRESVMKAEEDFCEDQAKCCCCGNSNLFYLQGFRTFLCALEAERSERFLFSHDFSLSGAVYTWENRPKWLFHYSTNVGKTMAGDSLHIQTHCLSVIVYLAVPFFVCELVKHYLGGLCVSSITDCATLACITVQTCIFSLTFFGRLLNY